MSPRPRRLWISLGLQGVFVLATGGAALLLGFAALGSIADGLFGPLLAGLLGALAAGAGALCFASVGGLVGTLRGERRGFRLALVTHAALALLLAGWGASDLLEPPPPGSLDTEAWKLSFFMSGIVLASLGILLTPASRAWFESDGRSG